MSVNSMKGAVLGWGSILVIMFIGTAAVIWVNTTTDVYKKVTDKAGDVIGVASTAELVRKMLDPSMNLAAQRATWELGQSGGIEGKPMWSTQQPSMGKLTEALRVKIMERMPKGNYKVNIADLQYGDGDISIGGWGSKPCGPANISKCFRITGFQSYSITDVDTDTWDRVDHKLDVIVNSSYFRLLYAGRMLFENESWPMPAGKVSVSGEDFTLKGITGCSGKLARSQSKADELPIKDLLGFSWRCGWGELPGIAAMGTWDEAKAKARLEAIARAMSIELENRHGLVFEIEPELNAIDYGSNVLVHVQTAVNITDPSGWVSVMPGDGSATINGKSYPLARQQLIFNTVSEFEMPKPAEVVPG